MRGRAEGRSEGHTGLVVWLGNGRPGVWEWKGHGGQDGGRVKASRLPQAHPQALGVGNRVKEAFRHPALHCRKG